MERNRRRWFSGMNRHSKFSILYAVVLAAFHLPSLVLLGQASAAEPSIDPRTIPTVATREFSIRFRADAAGGPITRAELWYSMDGGDSWRQWSANRLAAGLNSRDPEPETVAVEAIEFRGDEDGLYGFYVILHNVAGASAEPPQPGTRPQQWVRVVTAAPLVKLSSVRKDERFDRSRLVSIRWEVLGDHLPDRPVSLHYRTELTGSYRLLADLQEPVGAFLWTVPTEVRGRVHLKVTAKNLAGISGTAVYDNLRVDDFTATENFTPGDSGEILSTNHSPPGRSRANTPTSASAITSFPQPDETTSPHGEPDARIEPVDPATTEKARKLYDQGTWHRLRGEHDLAVARFREAVELDPRHYAARHDLAAVLLLQGRMDLAESELKRLLTADPDYRPALKTLALLHSRRKDYRSASETLQKLLLLDPRDPEVWLYFGDVALFTGDRPAAWTAWQKVGELDAATEEMRRRARTRLELYQSGQLPAEAVSSR